MRAYVFAGRALCAFSYYSLSRAENYTLSKRYEALAKQEQGVTFVGRIAQYRYYNMDQVAGAVPAAAKRMLRTSEDA
ncbi:MAG: hypothetical protein L0H63_12870 [Nitrococcus sp.]|nr:hypothetical protein [Nitrococcus sp.]